MHGCEIHARPDEINTHEINYKDTKHQLPVIITGMQCEIVTAMADSGFKIKNNFTSYLDSEVRTNEMIVFNQYFAVLRQILFLPLLESN